jgi:CBS domain-containing protein
MDRLDDLVARIMTTDVLTLEPGEALEGAARKLLERRVSGAPVLASDHTIVGVLTLADLTKKLGGSPERDDGGTVYFDATNVDSLLQTLLAADPSRPGVVRDVMSTQVLSVREGATLREVGRIMAERRVHRLLVTDEHGALRGIVSTLDVVGHLTG